MMGAFRADITIVPSLNRGITGALSKEMIERAHIISQQPDHWWSDQPGQANLVWGSRSRLSCVIISATASTWWDWNPSDKMSVSRLNGSFLLTSHMSGRSPTGSSTSSKASKVSEAQFNCSYTPCSLMVFLPSQYNRISNEQGKNS